MDVAKIKIENTSSSDIWSERFTFYNTSLSRLYLKLAFYSRSSWNPEKPLSAYATAGVYLRIHFHCPCITYIIDVPVNIIDVNSNAKRKFTP